MALDIKQMNTIRNKKVDFLLLVYQKYDWFVVD